MERKKRTFENFLSNKIVNLSDSAKHNIVYSNRIFGEFCQSKHSLSLDEIIVEAKKALEDDLKERMESDLLFLVQINPETKSLSGIIKGYEG